MNDYRELAKDVDLLNIFLQKSQCATFLVPFFIEKLISENKVSVDILSNSKVEKISDKIFESIFTIDIIFFNSSEKDDAKKKIAHIVASYVLQYSHNKLPEASEKCLKDFTEQNAVFNAYPFVRQFIAYTTSQFGIRSYILPLKHFKKNSVC